MVVESVLEAYLLRRVLAAGGMLQKITPAGKDGPPDRLVIHGGVVHLVELKTETGRLRPSQLTWHRKAAQRGVTVVVLAGKAEVDAWIEGLSHDPKARP